MKIKIWKDLDNKQKYTKSKDLTVSPSHAGDKIKYENLNQSLILHEKSMLVKINRFCTDEPFISGNICFQARA